MSVNYRSLLQKRPITNKNSGVENSVSEVKGYQLERLLLVSKLQVSFAKEPYKRDNILQKRPIILLTSRGPMVTFSRTLSLTHIHPLSLSWQEIW